MAALVLALPQDGVLPAFSLWALLASACAVLLPILPLRPSSSYSVGARDMAGAFTLVGCAAAILGEIEPITEIIRPSGPRSKAND